MKYIVWVFDEGKWQENGDGPLSQREAERIAGEIRRECGCRVRVLSVSLTPIDLG